MAPQTAMGPDAGSYHGLRMSADEFLALPESPIRCELVDGVVIVSPSPAFWHQQIISELIFQIVSFLEATPLGAVVSEMDVQLADDLVYRPDVVFLSSAKAARVGDRITEPPDLVVEVVSPGSRSLDTQTKRADYEATGVGEYWLIDPQRQSLRFFVLEDGTYREASPAGDFYASRVIAGLRLDVERIRRMF